MASREENVGLTGTSAESRPSSVVTDFLRPPRVVAVALLPAAAAGAGKKEREREVGRECRKGDVCVG